VKITTNRAVALTAERVYFAVFAVCLFYTSSSSYRFGKVKSLTNFSRFSVSKSRR